MAKRWRYKNTWNWDWPLFQLDKQQAEIKATVKGIRLKANHTQTEARFVEVDAPAMLHEIEQARNLLLSNYPGNAEEVEE